MSATGQGLSIGDYEHALAGLLQLAADAERLDGVQDAARRAADAVRTTFDAQKAVFAEYPAYAEVWGQRLDAADVSDEAGDLSLCALEQALRQEGERMRAIQADCTKKLDVANAAAKEFPHLKSPLGASLRAIKYGASLPEIEAASTAFQKLAKALTDLKKKSEALAPRLCALDQKLPEFSRLRDTLNACLREARAGADLKSCMDRLNQLETLLAGTDDLHQKLKALDPLWHVAKQVLPEFSRIEDKVDACLRETQAGADLGSCMGCLKQLEILLKGVADLKQKVDTLTPRLASAEHVLPEFVRFRDKVDAGWREAQAGADLKNCMDSLNRLEILLKDVNVWLDMTQQIQKAEQAAASLSSAYGFLFLKNVGVWLRATAKQCNDTSDLSMLQDTLDTVRLIQPQVHELASVLGRLEDLAQKAGVSNPQRDRNHVQQALSGITGQLVGMNQVNDWLGKLKRKEAAVLQEQNRSVSYLNWADNAEGIWALLLWVLALAPNLCIALYKLWLFLTCDTKVKQLLERPVSDF